MTPNRSTGSQLPTDPVKPVGDTDAEMVADGPNSALSKSVEQSPNEPLPTAREAYAASDNCPASPRVHELPYQQAYMPHLTPQTAGYYLYNNPQVTPEPPSPAASGYDMTSFLQQQAALGMHHGNPFGNAGQYGGIPQAPLSPTGGLIPPASPLFPRPAGTHHVAASFEQQGQRDSSVLQRIQGQAPPSPSPGYMSSELGASNGAGFGGAYSGYPTTGVGAYATVLNGSGVAGSPDEKGWGESMQQQYLQASPRLVPGLPGVYPGQSRAAGGNRSYSFDEMLPPSAMDPQEHNGAQYSPYSNPSVGARNAPFAHQQPWAYGMPGEMYNPPQSPLQQRQSAHMQNHFSGVHGGMGPPPMHIGQYGGQGPLAPYYPATSPGPPIQTTASNKGPDGANLFIFHIPNHFTNLDMFRLFCQYGNLLSVRIMVEKDTGRSRGFGFVSYDSSESAALAIKELNGFAIGNKRLKVQHKQIRGDQYRSNIGSPTLSGDPSFMPRPEDPAAYIPIQENAGISSTSWYDPTAMHPPASGAQCAETEDNHRDSAAAEELEDGVGGNTPVIPANGAEEAVVQVDASPLATLEPLLSALPDAGHIGAVDETTM